MSRIFWVVAAACLIAPLAKADVTINSTSFAVRQSAQDGNLYATGEVGQYVNATTAGTYTIVLYAQGTPVAGVYPVVGLSIDTFVKQQQTIAADPALYTYTGYLSAGVHKVCWFLHNDASTDTEDRNVFISYMTIAPPAGAADVSTSTYAAWATAAQARENQAVTESAAAINTYRKGPATVHVIDQNGLPIAGASVQVQQLSHAFRFGGSSAGLNGFGTSALNAAYESKFKAIFNYATVPMYWGLVEPSPGVFDFSHTDNQVNWAISNGLRVKTHALLYNLPAVLPAWMNGTMPGTQAQLDHLTVMMQRYGATASTWEIVNEPFNAPGTDVAAAHTWARSLSPTGEFCINEYGQLYHGYPELYAYLQQAINAGISFDAIGFQSHEPLNAAFPMDKVRDVLAHYATLGKSIHVTEFCPASSGVAVADNPWRSVWDEATQADYAEKFYRICFASPAVDAISWWDVCDTGAWNPKSGLLRADMSAKPAYDKLNALINTEWRTNLSGSSNSTGDYAFNGFYGTQRITVTAAGVNKTFDVALAKGGANSYNVSLTLPVVVTPTVTANRIITKNTKPTLTGTYTNATSVVVRVNGKNYTASLSGGNWSATVTTTLAAGTYDVAATATGTGGTTANDNTTGELSVDLTKPTITLVGASSITIKKRSTYTDAGATASDNVDGNITPRIVVTNGVNTNTTGTYYVTFNVSDTAGNAATAVKRTVKVIN